MLEFEIKQEGADKVALYLTSLGEKISEDELAMQASAILLDRTRKRFLSETDPYGKKWRQSEASKSRPTGTLYDTGGLFQSLKMARVSPGVYKVYVDQNTVNRKTNENISDYAYKHQVGDGVPERRFLGSAPAEQKEVAELVFGRLVAKLKK